VLPGDHGQRGPSSIPLLAADAAAQTGIAPRCGHRDATAAAPAIAATASATGNPASAGITGSGPAAASNTVKNTRTTSARPENRRCQPRTVSGGRPAAAAICRNDAPRALAASAAPITHAGCVVAGDFLADPDGPPGYQGVRISPPSFD